MRAELEAFHHFGAALTLRRIQVVVVGDVGDVIVDDVVKFCVDVVVTSDCVKASSGGFAVRQSVGRVLKSVFDFGAKK